MSGPRCPSRLFSPWRYALTALLAVGLGACVSTNAGPAMPTDANSPESRTIEGSTSVLTQEQIDAIPLWINNERDSEDLSTLDGSSRISPTWNRDFHYREHRRDSRRMSPVPLATQCRRLEHPTFRVSYQQWISWNSDEDQWTFVARPADPYVEYIGYRYLRREQDGGLARQRLELQPEVARRELDELLALHVLDLPRDREDNDVINIHASRMIIESCVEGRYRFTSDTDPISQSDLIKMQPRSHIYRIAKLLSGLVPAAPQ